jgi:hypothetical protein
MVNRKGRVYGHTVSSRSKLRILLTEAEVEQLDSSAAQSGAGSRTLLIAEAMRAGLANPNQTPRRERRSVIVDAWVPTTLLARLKEFANAHRLPQQHLFRLFLTQYLAQAPWNRDQTENKDISEGVLLQ